MSTSTRPAVAACGAMPAAASNMGVITASDANGPATLSRKSAAKAPRVVAA